MNKSQALTKTCSSCGLQKPLSAFLQMAGPEGTTYGSICSSCRKTAMEKPATPKEPGESRAGSGFKVDAKAKIHGDIDKKLHHQQSEELDKQEREKDEKLASDLTQKIETKAKFERKHRESYLEKRSFLSNERKTEPKHTVDAQQAAAQEAGKEYVATQEKVTKEEEQLKTIDLTGPYLPSQTGGQLKYQGSVFNQFKSWLGTSAPIVRAIEQAAQTSQPEGKKPAEKSGKEALMDYIDKTWGPHSKRR